MNHRNAAIQTARPRAVRCRGVRRSDAGLRAIARDGADADRKRRRAASGSLPATVRRATRSPARGRTWGRTSAASAISRPMPSCFTSWFRTTKSRPDTTPTIVETRDGRTLFGRLESEAPNSVTLRDGLSQSHVILRSQVVSMKESPVSMMPNELERAMSEQDLADLIAYLKTPPRCSNRVCCRFSESGGQKFFQKTPDLLIS